MADIIRVIKSDNFTAMSNYHLRDKRLSLKAVGLLSKLLSNADGYEVSIGGLAASGKDGRDAIRSGLNELMELGYVERTEQQRIGGKFTAGDYLIREVPVSEQDTAHRVGFTDAVEPSRKIQHKEITKEEISIKKDPPKAPQPGGSERKGQGRGAEAAWKPERFEAFWAYYPEHKAKEKARKAWDKLRPDDALIAEIGRALKRQKASDEWQRGIGIPYASTYLNQRRWEDEVRCTVAAGPGAPAATVQRPEVDAW